jgi:hypothetical protein
MRGAEACSVPVLAGMELVDLKGVTNLNPDQIRSTLNGLKRSGSAGLAISWDLLHIPLERLSLVRQVYLVEQPSPLQPTPHKYIYTLCDHLSAQIRSARIKGSPRWLSRFTLPSTT